MQISTSEIQGLCLDKVLYVLAVSIVTNGDIEYRATFYQLYQKFNLVDKNVFKKPLILSSFKKTH